MDDIDRDSDIYELMLKIQIERVRLKWSTNIGHAIRLFVEQPL